MASRRRRENDFTKSLNSFDMSKPLKKMARDNRYVDEGMNLFENKNIINECMAQNSMEDSITSQCKLNDKVLSEFDTILFSLDSELNPMETNTTKEEVYKRLFAKYISSSQTLTDKLVTMIEESVINNTLNTSDNSIIIFEKLSKETQKLCGNIENESMPTQLLSTTISESPSKEMMKIIINNNSTEITNKKYCSEAPSLLSSNTDSCTIKTPSPTNVHRKVYRKTPRSIFESETKKDIVPLSPSEDNDLSFKSLEAYCEKLFPNKKKDRASLQSVQNSASLSMSPIYKICEQQLALLNSSKDDIKVISQKENENSVKELQKKSKDTSYCVYPKSENSTHKDDSKKEELERIDEKTHKVDSNDIYYADELDKTLLSEIAEKRRRCLHTAKKMIEINSECNALEVKKRLKTDYKSTIDVDSNKPQNNNAMFLDMLISCKDYHNYLENQLPMLNDLSKSFAHDQCINKSFKNNINTDLTPNKNKLSMIKNNNSKSRRSNIYTKNFGKVLARLDAIGKINTRKVENTTNKTKYFCTPEKTLHTTKKQRAPVRASINRSEKFSSLNCSTMLSPNKRVSIKSPLKMKSNQLLIKSVKSPLGRVSKLNATHISPCKSLIRQNLLSLRKCNTNLREDKENKINE